MNDQPPTSGSRWEPTDQDNQPAEGQTPEGQTPGRSRALIAGAAVGLLGVGGLGGFALGATTAGGERGDESSVVDRDGLFGDRHGDDGGRLPPGFDPSQGQFPPELGGDTDSDTHGDTDSGSRT